MGENDNAMEYDQELIFKHLYVHVHPCFRTRPHRDFHILLDAST